MKDRHFWGNKVEFCKVMTVIKDLFAFQSEVYPRKLKLICLLLAGWLYKHRLIAKALALCLRCTL